MFMKTAVTHEILNPVAISEKELLSDPSFKLLTHELCTRCGAQFGSGYRGAPDYNSQSMDEIEELPGILTEILAKDHRRNRPHKGTIDLDFGLSPHDSYR